MEKQELTFKQRMKILDKGIRITLEKAYDISLADLKNPDFFIIAIGKRGFDEEGELGVQLSNAVCGDVHLVELDKALQIIMENAIRGALEQRGAFVVSLK